MPSVSFDPAPDSLPAHQRAYWIRRQHTAQAALALQAQAGRVANAETVAICRHYVQGNITLAQAR